MTSGVGLVFDGFGLYMASGVMPALIDDGWPTMQFDDHFASTGALAADRRGARWVARRPPRPQVHVPVHLGLFGIMSLAAAVALPLTWLIALRCPMGIGLGGEIVVGYATIAESCRRRGADAGAPCCSSSPPHRN